MTGRLIDADVLKKDLTRFYDNEVTAKQLIDEQPTVEAIPVKWLKENFPTNGVYGTESYFRKAHVVEDILKDWELEKEKRKEE